MATLTSRMVEEGLLSLDRFRDLVAVRDHLLRWARDRSPLDNAFETIAATHVLLGDEAAARDVIVGFERAIDTMSETDRKYGRATCEQLDRMRELLAALGRSPAAARAYLASVAIARATALGLPAPTRLSP
jgi:hypothetical protein